MTGPGKPPRYRWLRWFRIFPSGAVFWAFLVVVTYAIFSVTVAMATADDCGRLNADKEWKFIPPAWECKAP